MKGYGLNIFVEKKTVDWIGRINAQLKTSIKGEVTIYLPAGSTPIPLYQDWCDHNHDFLEKANFQQIDEVIGTMMFENFFKEHLSNRLVMPIENKIIQGDIAILGVGLNGHVGFHEPQIPITFEHGEVELSQKSCEILNIDYPSKGLTYGLSVFLKCKKIIVIARGAKKRDILNKCLDPNSQLPCAHILKHENCDLITDFNLD